MTFANLVSRTWCRMGGSAYLADTRTAEFFRGIGDNAVSDDAFKRRRGEFFPAPAASMLIAAPPFRLGCRSLACA